MKNITYKFLALFIASTLASACGDKEKDNENNGYSHNEEAKTEIKEKNHEGDEVMLSLQQFETLKMKIDTLALRNLSSYVEANGTLEVPPQNEAAITSVVGANVVSIKVIEGDKINKSQVVAYLSHPNIIKLQTDYLNAYSNSNFLKCRRWLRCKFSESKGRVRGIKSISKWSGSSIKNIECQYNIYSEWFYCSKHCLAKSDRRFCAKS